MVILTPSFSKAIFSGEILYPSLSLVPTVAPAATIHPAQVEQAPTVTAAHTTLSEDELAKTAGVQRIPTIDPAKVQVKEGAVAQRVVGQLSPQATATAAQASGTTLARVTRAKKQLRTAGLGLASKIRFKLIYV